MSSAYPCAIELRSSQSPSVSHSPCLTLGKYDTEVDTLTHGSFWTALRLANLIGGSDDVESLKDYSRKLPRLCVEEQVVYFPCSLSRVEAIIIEAKALDDAIIHNAMSMIELSPFTTSKICAAKIGANFQCWETTKENQLDAVYSYLQHSADIPERR